METLKKKKLKGKVENEKKKEMKYKNLFLSAYLYEEDI